MVLSGRAAREYSGAHFRFQRKPERQSQWSKDSKSKIANWPSQFQADSYKSHLFWFQFWFFHFTQFSFHISLLWKVVVVQLFSLKFLWLFSFYSLFYLSIFLLHFCRPLTFFIKRKVLAQSFQDPPVSKQSMLGASKVQKAKAKSRNSIVSPSSPQNAIV
jgi:hypothetical protein